ncbi:hypothetical protein CEUSTIGMA_g1872.t1 [Chlamydomonas eustigma]|uniref:Cyclin-like domain-containing protein n=1 Tax=Chlamydomonas eustigma TaxID=1157962 RepID=A0A250WUC6_9CHLO|nr:hypothetical protein CEUSTIGMA_g1872.t1 [Chlamydomonas eustigma]|eukprot:GAX74423.1 hypothetical protein CEUSTIGMA_g1872.t1 [Chlamydomonas eustigma]
MLDDVQNIWQPRMYNRDKDNCCTPCSAVPHKQVTDQISPLDDRFESLSLSAQSFSTRASGSCLYSFGDVTCDESLLSPSDNDLCNSPSLSTSGNALFEHDIGDLYDVALLIRNEAQRQKEQRPPCKYLKNHPNLDARLRRSSVSFIMEVARACNLQASTLFLATSYLDRFLAVAQAVTSNMMILVSMACISLASKQEEVLQATAAEWTAISDNAFKEEDLSKMEWLILCQLGWRSRSPTAFTFLHLLSSGIGASQLSPQTSQYSQYLLELSLLDYGALEYDAVTIASASLLAAHRMNHQSELGFDSVLAFAPFLSYQQVTACTAELDALHTACVCCVSEGSADADLYRPLLTKYFSC